MICKIAFQGVGEIVFHCSSAREWYFNLLASVEAILEHGKPSLVEVASIAVWRPHKLYISASRWVPVIELHVLSQAPFLDFDLLDYEHPVLYQLCLDYERWVQNPCFEIPLVDQKCGTLCPM